MPIDPNTLFQAFSVSTKWSSQRPEEVLEQEAISLALRGDGVQARYVSSLLHYIAENSSLFHIWGFEEPENSVEYNLAIDLASDFVQIYSRETQIFVTSHSPAFVSLQGPGVVSYRVYKDDNSTKIALLSPSSDETVFEALGEDIGLFRIQQELYHQYIERRKELNDIHKEVDRLRAELEQTARPVVYVEGKTDEMILNTAWAKLFSSQEMPFVVTNCDPLSEDNSDGGAAGVDTLAKLLSTIRADSKHVVIGVFDRDQDGISTYKKSLPNYFKEISEVQAKVSQNRKAAALLLPTPVGKELYAQYSNLCIEFYFSESALAQQTSEGWGLEFRQPETETKIKMKGAPILETKPSTLPETRQIAKGKTVFARNIVPTLDVEEFEPFKLVFDQIEHILDYLQINDSESPSDEEIILPEIPSLTPSQAYKQILSRLRQLGTISPLLFGRNYYSLDDKVHFIFRFSKTHHRSGEDVYFLGVTAHYFERVHSMGNAFLVFVLGSPDNALIIPTGVFAEWLEGIEPSRSNGVWPLAVYQSPDKEHTAFWVQGQARRDVAMYLNDFDNIRRLL